MTGVGRFDQVERIRNARPQCAAEGFQHCTVASLAPRAALRTRIHASKWRIILG